MLIDLNQVRYLRGLGGHLPQWLVDAVLDHGAVAVADGAPAARRHGRRRLARRLRADEAACTRRSEGRAGTGGAARGYDVTLGVL